MITKPARAYIIYACLLALLYSTGCNRHKPLYTDAGRPKPTLTQYFDAKYLLYKLPDDYYKNKSLDQSFTNASDNSVTDFKPLGFDTALNLQYTHVYSAKCVYTIPWKYAEVCFPNTCLTKDKAHAKVHIKNTSTQAKTYYTRLFYQNTSYWYPTNDSINLNKADYLDNYYGASPVVSVTLDAQKDTIIDIPYRLGLDPKDKYPYLTFKDPARPGNYEFMLLTLPDKDPLLDNPDIDLGQFNPFAEVKKDLLQNNGKKYGGHVSYTAPHHFKFVFLDEYFDGKDDLAADHVFLPKEGKEKKLCDTCTGYYKNVISEKWSIDDFFNGPIAKAPLVKADYGIKKQNCSIDTNGIILTIPASERGKYKKTWGEFLFGPGIRYGHVTIRAKLAQMINECGTPNGIIHNIWLYQRDRDAVDTANPYNYLRNSEGKQPYEIDFEVWNCETGLATSTWKDSSYINYSIVDYMRDANVAIKPKEKKQFGKYTADRLNERQLNIPGHNLSREYFNSFHTYELYWYPDHVTFLVDGLEEAKITSDMAKIPDKYAFLWIGSPLYQDGQYYSQRQIPFLTDPKYTIVDYIRIE